jgi:hypothetical protein
MGVRIEKGKPACMFLQAPFEFLLLFLQPLQTLIWSESLRLLWASSALRWMSLSIQDKIEKRLKMRPKSIPAGRNRPQH